MQDWSILSKFAKRNLAKSSVFYWLFLGEVSPWNFPLKSADFSKNLPLKILQNLTFLHWNPRNRLICLRILTFSREYPAKSADFSANFDFFPAKIPRNRPIFPRICPWKSREIFLFFREISEALLSATGLLPSLKVKVKVETNKDSSSIKVRKFLNGREENKTLATPYPLPTNSVQMPVNFHNFGELHLCSLWNLAILLTLILSGVFT